MRIHSLCTLSGYMATAVEQTAGQVHCQQADSGVLKKNQESFLMAAVLNMALTERHRSTCFQSADSAMDGLISGIDMSIR